MKPVHCLSGPRHHRLTIQIGTVFCLLLLICGSVLSARAELVYLDLTASNMRKVMVAVPSFVNSSAPGQDRAKGRAMAKLLARGLEFHGFIKIMAPERYGDRQDADWKSLGVDYVILGHYETTASGMMIEGRLLDVTQDKMLVGRRYRGSVKQQDEMVLMLCDSLIKEFTGEPGISRTRIAFISDATGYKEAYISDVLGLKLRQVTRNRHLVVSPRFSPDGRYLAYSSYHTGNQNLYVTDLSQNKITRAISRRPGMNLAPAWAPDGKTMIVTLSKDGNPDLYIIDRQGRILKRLTSREGINVSATWAPDGKSIAFVSDRSGTPQIYIMDMKNHRTRRLTFQGNENTEPCWSPKGNLIAYTGRINGHHQIFTIDPAGTAPPRQVTSGPGEFESPTWSPDGKQIALSRRLGDKQQLYAIFADGRGLRVLFHLKGNQSYPQWSCRPK
ncbi:translocation protein TolB [bacterium BMS3Bbin14]|nr:translocation protein TolB [bacterium BMS3Abin13]GBE51896.1 translocation protein TolB [bacterium BMS3Bbin14]HDK43350.1 Tol-Pal system beta propeller repeat protein TolB [Desulfobacteraceae bacterium]HDL98718.1 Tol-Pal system beta propeller repeat protein TolB [Desulfobacteraceae bacterium]HDO30404.1 Tol-Pal system beta propeller repeat protein TolB [Desulfobacteraceae bacterium]